MESGSVLSNCIIYLADGFSAGYPFGVVTAEDEFDISLRITNCQATYLGHRHVVRHPPGRYGGKLWQRRKRHPRFPHPRRLGLGLRLPRLHIAGGVAGVIDGLCITRMSDKPGVLDIYVRRQAATPDNATGPGYKVQIRGPQIGTSAYLNDADRILIDGSDIDNVTSPAT
jgi:hypothetical protein